MKKFDSSKLFKLACQDVVERFHLLISLLFVLVGCRLCNLPLPPCICMVLACLQPHCWLQKAARKLYALCVGVHICLSVYLSVCLTVYMFRYAVRLF